MLKSMSLILAVALILASSDASFAQSCSTPSPCCSADTRPVVGHPACGPLAPNLSSPPDVTAAKGCVEICNGSQVVACYGGTVVDLAGLGVSGVGGNLNNIVRGEVEPIDGCLCIGALCIGGDHHGNICLVSAELCAETASQECAEPQSNNPKDNDFNLTAIVGGHSAFICPPADIISALP